MSLRCAGSLLHRIRLRISSVPLPPQLDLWNLSSESFLGSFRMTGHCTECWVFGKWRGCPMSWGMNSQNREIWSTLFRILLSTVAVPSPSNSGWRIVVHRDSAHQQKRKSTDLEIDLKTGYPQRKRSMLGYPDGLRSVNASRFVVSFQKISPLVGHRLPWRCTLTLMFLRFPLHICHLWNSFNSKQRERVCKASSFCYISTSWHHHKQFPKHNSEMHL